MQVRWKNTHVLFIKYIELLFSVKTCDFLLKNLKTISHIKPHLKMLIKKLSTKLVVRNLKLNNYLAEIT